MDERFERAPVGVLAVRPDGTVTDLNDAARELLGLDAGGAAGSSIDAVFPESVENAVPEAFRGEPPEEGIEEYYPALDRWLAVSLVPTDGTVTVYLEDVTDRRRDERAIDRLRGDLDRLSVINQLISDVLAELVGASTREEIAETICDRLGETGIYEFAWLGEREVGGDDIVVRAAAGATGRTLERIRESLGGSGAVPERRAVETGSAELVQPLGGDESVPEPMRRAAFADGLQSLLAIPLTYGSSVYGVVGVYAADRDAFSERERASFATLGELAGFAINATRNRSLLLSDTVVELELDLSGGPLTAAAAQRDAELSVEGLVPRGEDGLLCYLGVEGAAPGAVATALAGSEGAGSARVVGEHGDAGSVEVELDGGTALGRLAAHGGTVRSAGFEGGSGRVVVELPPEEDIRRIADALTRQLDASVLAKREREREVATAREFRDELRDRLTGRQETALRTAFFADYFESPRGSTAEEVAAALGITGPTLLYHLRAGQRKLLAEFFETTDGERPDGDR